MNGGVFLSNGLQNAMQLPYARAVAAGPVSPVSTGPLFPLPWRAWRRQSHEVAPLLSERPRMAPKCTPDMLKLARWLRTVRKSSSESERPSLPTTVRSSKPHLRRVWLAWLANDRKSKTSVVRRSGHTSETLSSGLREASY